MIGLSSVKTELHNSIFNSKYIGRDKHTAT